MSLPQARFAECVILFDVPEFGIFETGRGSVRRIDVRGGAAWQGEWSDAQGRRRRRVLAGTKADAEKILSKLVRDRDLELAGMGAEFGAPLDWETLVEQYLAELATRSKPRSVKEARAMLARFHVELGVRTVRDVTRPALTRWRLACIGEGMSHKRANNYVVTLAAALNLALRLGQIASNPIAGLRALPITAVYQVRKPRALSEDEIGRLLAEAEKADRVPIRWRPRRSTAEELQHGSRGQECGSAAPDPHSRGLEPRARGSTCTESLEHCRPFPRAPLVRALIATGARWGELVATRWADLDEARALLTLRAETTKTAVERTIPIDRDTLASMLELRGEAQRVTGQAPLPASRIFLSPQGRPWSDSSSFRKHFHALCTRAGIAHRDDRGHIVSPHSCRHTHATRLARSGVPIQVAQLLTGHRSVQVLAGVYTHLRVEDARAAVEGLPRLPGRIPEPAPPLRDSR